MTQEEIDKLLEEWAKTKQSSPEVLPQDFFGFYGAEASYAKCECGGDKTYGEGSNIHSYWCPKYKK